MIRTSSLNLNNATKSKLAILDTVLEEYTRLVNIYIEILYKQNDIPKYTRIKVPTWFSARLSGKACKQAVAIIKSTKKKDNDIRYKRYKKVYAYFIKRNRQLKFLNKKFSELNLIAKIKPQYSGDVMELDKDILNFLDISNTTFDKWIKIYCIGNKVQLKIPCNIHKHFKKYKNWKLMSGCRLRKYNDNWYLDCFFEKENFQKQTSQDVLALDLGINCLISGSNDEQYGKQFKQLLQDLDKKQQSSKAANRKRTQIKNYINQQVNKLPLKNYDKLVLEDLRYIQIGTKERVNKTTRKYLSRWNLGQLKQQLKNKCEENGIQITFINPKYTSQTCPKCSHVDKKNRHGESFKCQKCGYITNADINAAHNILQRFLSGELLNNNTVPDSKKRISI